VTLAAPYRTNSGRMVDLLNPTPEDVCLEDIAHHLARVCRFGGAVDRYYSVASHSVYVAANIVTDSRELQRAALLHDAAEAYLGDMVSGLKQHMWEFKFAEGSWNRAIQDRFGVRFQGSVAIKEADLRARLSEARDLFVGYPRELLLGGEGDRAPFAARCVEHTPDEAEWAFLAMADRLGVGS
jgi:5'-deoxynucleotidase YfbR-like HD superfamily hydrolase